MKQLARKNASLKQKIKVQLAAKNIEDLLSRMLTTELDASHRISDRKVREVVVHMQEFAGKTAFGTIENKVLRKAIATSLGKNIEVNPVAAESREMPEPEGPQMRVIHIPTYPSHEGVAEEDAALSKKYGMQLEPSGHTRTSVSSGTSGKPIDIEKLASRKQQVAE